MATGFSLFAQQSINSMGGDGSNKNLSVSFSAGEVFQTIEEEGSLSVDGTVLSLRVKEVTNISEDDSPNFEISVFPNPTSDFVTVQKNDECGNLQCELYSINGSVLKSKTLKGKKEQISMQSYEQGTYLLKISDNTGVERIFKIVKTK